MTIEKRTAEQPARPRPRPRLGLSALIGSGDRIGAFILPIAVGGVALYLASRWFAPAEEADLARRFGPEWDSYRRSVTVPWL